MAYDPWRDLRDNWPGIRVVAEPMSGRLLGELRYPVIALRTGTSAAQQRCTLAHELVHLERGLGECGPWAAREERLVHREAARRLVAADALVDAIREASGTADLAGLARRLDVDCETIRTRLQIVSRTEVARIRAALRALRCAA
ncbi:MAG: hypothetical protein QOE97_968 [Pseudonocardiales bacterium]|nr:hypothetical protein [Pseudonocardiales bacterium]